MESVDDVITALMEDWDTPGCAVAIVRHGRLAFARGYGYANQEDGELVQPDSLFRIASISKQITAVAILKLVEDGELRLSDKAFDILDDLEPAPGRRVDSRLYDITILDLLQHSAGWDTDALGFDPQISMHRTAAITLGESWPAEAETLIRYMLGWRLSYDPGTSFDYSNFGYNVLGRVIEAVSGVTYEEYVKASILQPIGIDGMRIGRTRFEDRAPGEVAYYDHPGGGATQSVFSGGGQVAYPYGAWYLEAMDSHGGWIASAIDIMRFVTHIDGRPSPDDILQESSIERMVARPSLDYWSDSSYFYALGWLVRPKTADANWWHTGSLDGTTCIVVRA